MSSSNDPLRLSIQSPVRRRGVLISAVLPKLLALTALALPLLAQPLDYEVVDGLAIYEGDIILGPARSPKDDPRVEAVFRIGEAVAWPGGVIPYQIAPDIPQPQRIHDAIADWQEKTSIRFIPHAAEADWLLFERSDSGGVCFSAIGRTGGMQTIRVADGCGPGTMIHEIGHTVGMWHEQARPDRDDYIEVREENIDPVRISQFRKRDGDGEGLGPYDYASVMHYSGSSFSRNGLPTIVTKPLGIPLAGPTLSPLDVDAVRRFYGQPRREIVIDTNPSGIGAVVDGVEVETPAVFVWAEGSVHQVEAVAAQFVKVEKRSFARWADGSPRSRTVTVSAERGAYVADYVLEFQVTGTADPVEGGLVRILEASDDDYYPAGSDLTIEALPAPGFHFIRWDGLPTRGPLGLASNPAPIFAAPTRTGLRAVFSIQPPTLIDTEPTGMLVRVDGDRGAFTPHAFVWEPGSLHTLNVDERIDEEDARTVFIGWADGEPSPTRQITAAASPSSYVALFRTQYLVKAGVVPFGSGTILLDPLSPDGFYDAQQTVSLTAAPEPGYTFVAWRGSVNSPQNPFLLTVDAPHDIAASFFQEGKVLPGGVVNAASFVPGGVSPGLIFTLFGVRIGPETTAGLRLTPDGLVATELEGVRIRLNGFEAPLLYVSPNQISAVAPYQLDGLLIGVLEIEVDGVIRDTVRLPISQAAPGVFTLAANGVGQAAAVNQDGSLNGPAAPAPPGSIVTLYATGEGATTPTGVNGLPAQGILPQPKLPVRAWIGGVQARIEYAGGAPGFVAGLMQLNIAVPLDAPAGEAVPLALKIGDQFAEPEPTIAVGPRL